MSEASRAVAGGMLLTGLGLIGFGVVIVALPEVFAYLAGAVFFVAGMGCAITAGKIYLAQRRLEKSRRNSETSYRENVQIHIEDHHDA